MPQYPSLGSPYFRCYYWCSYIIFRWNWMNRIIGFSLSRFLFILPRTVRICRYRYPKIWQLWDSHLYSSFPQQPYLNPYCWRQPRSSPQWWPWHIIWGERVRIGGSTMIMMAPSMMTLGKMDWGTMRILIVLTRVRILPASLTRPICMIWKINHQWSVVQFLMEYEWGQYID